MYNAGIVAVIGHPEISGLDYYRYSIGINPVFTDDIKWLNSQRIPITTYYVGYVVFKIKHCPYLNIDIQANENINHFGKCLLKYFCRNIDDFNI